MKTTGRHAPPLRAGIEGVLALMIGLAGPPLVLAGAPPGPVDSPGWTARPLSSPLGPATLRALALQVALEARGYSPGLLDGSPGPRTRLALAAFQARAGLAPSGEATGETWSLLAPRPEAALGRLRVAPGDLALIDPPPRDWVERSRKKRLLYASLANLLAERAHTTERLLAALNPDLDLGNLEPGQVVLAPAPPPARCLGGGLGRIEIDLERKVVLLFTGRRGPEAPVGLLHCSTAADPGRAPIGEWRVADVAVDPTYTFDPAKWPEVRGVDRRLLIPPGPRSPVGLRWIGLEAPGIGIHGSPEPEMIGKTGSHGCFRLTNWDAIWLADLVAPGIPVKVVRTARESSWSWTP